MADTPDAYKTLQVDPEADPEVIQAAYRRLAQKYHPDLAGDATTEAGREAMTRMVAINAAWAVLRDPARRAEFDRERAARAAAAQPIGTPRPAGPDAVGTANRGWDRPNTGDAGGAAQRGSGGVAAGSAAAPNTAAGGAASSPPGSQSRPAAGANQSSWSGRVSTAGRPPGETGGSPSGAASGSSATAPRTPADGAPVTTGPTEGTAGRAPGRPVGSVLNFGRYSGWSVGQIGSVDPEYLEWLFRAPIGRPYTEELDALLRKLGRVTAPDIEDKSRKGLFRRR